MYRNIFSLPLLAGISVAVMLVLAGLVNHSKRSPASIESWPPAEQLAGNGNYKGGYTREDRKTSRIAFAIAPSVQPSNFKHATDNRAHTSNQEEVPKWTDKVVAWFTIILTISTVGLWYFAWLQSCDTKASLTVSRSSAEAAQRSADIAERALIAGQRAFVSISFRHAARRVVGSGEVDGWSFTPVWVNTGETPTRNTINHISLMASDTEFTDDWRFPDLWGKDTTIEKRVNIPFGIGPKYQYDGHTLFVAVNTLDEVIAGRKFLYFWGWCAYSDVLPNTKRHITRFAVRIVIGGNPRDSERVSFTYSNLGRYNCSDDDCEYQGFPADWKPQEMLV